MRIGSFTIGYHGCDAEVASLLLNERTKFLVSDQVYEWLGNGMYFWENNMKRGLDWAWQKYEKNYIKRPAVVGALLDLRNCCDFSDQRYLDLFKSYHQDMVENRVIQGRDMPVNYAPKGTLQKDMVARNLDCAVVEYMHEEMKWLHDFGVPEKFNHKTKPFDSVRGLFTEGQPVFKGSGIYHKSHIQICIRNPECIVGFFLPREDGLGIGTGMEVREEPALFG